MTTPERWKEIDRIFAAALELEPAARAAFLSQACGGDEELRKEVESLLAHDLPESLVGEQAVEEATQLLVNPRGENPSIEYIGPYQVIRSLGAGGMGQVYLAQDLRLNRPVAVKLISGYDMAEEERIRRFRREALAASALNHPNILTIYEIGETDGHNFIATEFVDGQTLLDLIKSGPSSVATTTDIAIQIASALAAAHAAGIVHRDIKPANLMIRPDGLLKVLDFGIAKYSQPDNTTPVKESTVETAIGTVIGTAAYMSPEQARAAPIDPRTDIWSLGVILYEMVTGQRPFAGKTTLDTMAAVIANQPLPLTAHELTVPVSFERIVFKTLQKDREARYQTANQLLADLKDLKKTLESDAEDRGEAATAKHPQSGLRKETGVSIAVLPFVNMSADPENEYFCDGLSEELLNALTKIEDLKVAARTSTFSFKGKDVTVSGIGRALNVTSVLEGSVRKSGNQLRISVQLINAANGYQVWSARYDRELQDIFDIQDEIALAVVDALKVTLLGSEKAAVLKRHTENVEAYQLYLKGRYYWWKTEPEEFAKGLNYFERALEADASYALSYCGLNSYYGFGAAWGMLPPSVGWPKALEANAKALELDDTLAEVHNNLGGQMMVYRRDPAAAEQAISRALKLNPRFQEAHYLYSFFLSTRRRFDEAIAEAKRALEIDPFSLRLNHHLGNTYYTAGKYDEAIHQYQQAVELDAKNPSLHESLGDAFEQNAMYDEAVAEWQKAKELSGDNEGATLLSNVYAKDGFDEAVRAVANRSLERLQGRQERGDYIPAIHFARAYTRLGNTEQAFLWLEKACAERNVFPLLLHADPLYDSLRSDPRFAELLERFGLTGAESTPLNSAGRITTEAPPPVSTSPGQHQREETATHQPRVKLKTRQLLVGGGVIGLLLLFIAGPLVYVLWHGRQTSVMPGTEIKSLAVLPLKSLDAGENYLGLGIADAVIRRISQTGKVIVRPTSAVRRYLNEDTDALTAARQLNTDAVLEGNVQRAGDRLRVSVNLLRTSDGVSLWNDSFDMRMTDIFTIQDSVAQQVAARLRLQLDPSQQARFMKRSTSNPIAYEFYVKGVYSFDQRGFGDKAKPQMEATIGLFKNAIEADPNYALAHAQLAYAYAWTALFIEPTEPAWVESAKEQINRAQVLDPQLAETHVARHFILQGAYEGWQTEAAIRELLLAQQLNPNVGHEQLGLLYLHIGLEDLGVQELQKALSIDPTSEYVKRAIINSYVNLNRYDEGLAAQQKFFNGSPDAWYLLGKGRLDEAQTQIKQALLKEPDNLSVHRMKGILLALRGDFPAAEAEIPLLLSKRSVKDFAYHHLAYDIACVYALAGKNNEAVKWLSETAATGFSCYPLFERDPYLDRIRKAPEFVQFMAEMKAQFEKHKREFG